MSQTTMTRGRGSYVERPSSASLADVINIILDKGIVIDAFVRVSLVGIEVITIDARIVIASVDTYLRFAEATNRLDLAKTGGRDLPELFQDLNEGGASGKTKGIIGGVKEALTGSEEKSSGQRSGQGQSRQRSEGERSTSRRDSS